MTPETERLAEKNSKRQRLRVLTGTAGEDKDLKKADNIEKNNLGTMKYDRQKEKVRRRTETFINAEINRMLRAEKPGRVVITRPIVIKNRPPSRSKAANRRLSRSFY